MRGASRSRTATPDRGGTAESRRTTSRSRPGTAESSLSKWLSGGRLSRPPLFFEIQGRDLVPPVTPKSELSHVPPDATDYGRTSGNAERAGDDCPFRQAPRLPRG